MITHDDARTLVNWLKGSKLFDYIDQNEQRDRDIARYIELGKMSLFDLSEEEYNEWLELDKKLSNIRRK